MRLSWWLQRSKQLMVLGAILFMIHWLQGTATDRQHHTSGHSDSSNRDMPSLNLAAKVPAPEPLSRWVIALTEDPKACNLLAASFPNWNLLLTSHQPDTLGYRSSRCQYVNSAYGPRPDDIFLSACELAVKGGADVIYVIPEGTDLAILQPPATVVYDKRARLVLADSSEPFLNLADHFGYTTSKEIKASKARTSLRYSLCEINRPAIQVLPNICCREQGPCDPTAPVVVASTGLFAPVQLQHAVFLKEAFWALPMAFASGTLSLNVSMAIQTRLWELDSGLMILNTAEGLAANCDQSDEFVKKMSSLCGSQNRHTCRKLLLRRYASFPLPSSLVRLHQQWSRTVPALNAPLKQEALNVSSPRCVSSVKYWPVSRTHSRDLSGHSSKTTFTLNQELNVELYSQMCGVQDGSSSLGGTVAHLAYPWTQFTDILLIVVFNNPFYDVIPYLELLYRSFFPFILYCGPHNISLDLFPKLRNYSFSFIAYGDSPAGHVPGAFNYRCITMAIDMHYRVAGYLVIPDDMVLFPHKLSTFKKQSIWFVPPKEVRIGELHKLRECRLGMCDFFPHWHWWEDYQHQSLLIVRTLQRLQHSSHLVNRCYRQLVSLNGGEFRLNGAYSDIFYIPRRLQEDFKSLAELFLEHEVFFEIAVPSIVRCLEFPEDVVPLPGTPVWDMSRDQTWLYWTATNVIGKTFLHPTKWSYLHSTNVTIRERDQHRRVLCDHILPFLHDPFARFKEWNSTEFYRRKRRVGV